MRKNLFFASSIGILLGVCFGSLYPFSYGVAGFILILISMFLMAVVLLKYRETTLWVVFLSIGVFLGYTRMGFVDTSPPPVFLSYIGSEQILSGTVVADPDIRETVQHVVVRIQKEERETTILVTAPLFPRVSYGDDVVVHGRVERPQEFETEGGRTFRYDMFLAKEEIFLVARDASIASSSGEKNFFTTLIAGFFSVKHRAASLLAESVPEPESALAEGMLIGGKQGLGEKLVHVFTVTGLIHIVVLSGYNVMIIAEAVRLALSFLPRFVSYTGAGLVVLLFVGVSGADAASVRAGLMATIGLFARGTGRTYDAARALLFVAVVMVLFHPLLLLYDPGFQLSFVATLGLILGAPLLEKKMSFCTNSFCRELLASTGAAHLAVLPLLLFQTGILSLVSLPANILVLPLVPLGMATAAGAAVASFLIPPLAPVFGLPAFVILRTVLWIADFFASLPFAHIIVPAFPITLMFGAYALIFLGYRSIASKKSFSMQQRPN